LGSTRVDLSVCGSKWSDLLQEKFVDSPSIAPLLPTLYILNVGLKDAKIPRSFFGRKTAECSTTDTLLPGYISDVEKSKVDVKNATMPKSFLAVTQSHVAPFSSTSDHTAPIPGAAVPRTAGFLFR